MSDFARKLSYGATKPRPHNAAGAPEDKNRAGDGPALAMVPEADTGESGAEVTAETGAAEAEAVAEGAAESAETDADTVAETDAADGAAEGEAEAEDAEPDTSDQPAAEAEEPEAPAAEPARAAESDVSAPIADAGATEGGDSAAAEVAEPGSPLPGETTIADEVVEKVAGIAARKVPGVYDLGGDASRLVSTVRERIGLGEGSSGRGISVTLSGRAATLAVTLVVEYGHAVYQVADQVRKDVGDAVEKMLGIDVTELNIVVDDVHVPDA